MQVQITTLFRELPRLQKSGGPEKINGVKILSLA